MSNTFFQYGNYRHPDWEMNLMSYRVFVKMSPRNKMLSRVYRLHLRGEIQSTTGSTGITTRLNAILSAYYVQNRDAQFYVNGQLTPHYAFNSDSISGVKVMNIEHPFGDGSEYANRRNIDIVIQSEQEAPESQLVDWQETVRWVGNTSQRDEWFQGFERPRKQRVCKRTVQRIIQSGSAIGWAGYVEPPGPLWPLSEHEDRRSLEFGTPKCMGQTLRLHPSRWTYIHTVGDYTEAFPNIR
jgi:hypothetical protein